MGWQISTVDFEDKRDVMGKFIVSPFLFFSPFGILRPWLIEMKKSNGTMGYFIWGGMVADYISKVVFSK
jgi:hypothetical protein